MQLRTKQQTWSQSAAIEGLVTGGTGGDREPAPATAPFARRSPPGSEYFRGIIAVLDAVCDHYGERTRITNEFRIRTCAECGSLFSGPSRTKAQCQSCKSRPKPACPCGKPSSRKGLCVSCYGKQRYASQRELKCCASCGRDRLMFRTRTECDSCKTLRRYHASVIECRSCGRVGKSTRPDLCPKCFYAATRVSRNLSCADCGVALANPTPGGGPRRCDACRSERRRSTNRRKNAKRRGLVPGKYLIADVGDRDGWVCHLCGDGIDRHLPGTAKWGPTIDHLLPVSRGGTDDLSNVAVAHRHCNVVRRDSPLVDRVC